MSEGEKNSTTFSIHPTFSLSLSIPSRILEEVSRSAVAARILLLSNFLSPFSLIHELEVVESVSLDLLLLSSILTDCVNDRSKEYPIFQYDERN